MPPTADHPERRPARPVDDGVLLPVGVVAARLGTSVSSLRAWERRYGLRPSGRTAGGHRRYSTADLERLTRMRGLLHAGVPAAHAARMLAAEAQPPATDAARLLTAARALDFQALCQQADAALGLGAATAWESVLGPALTAMGLRWEQTERGVENEHLASGVIEAALRRHAQRAWAGAAPPNAARTSRRALLAATPGEAHTLPLAALAATLAEDGWRALTLGALPRQALCDAIAGAHPAVVVLWTRMSAHADADCLAAARAATDAPVHTAGPGWPASTAEAGQPAHLDSLAAARRAVVAALSPTRPPTPDAGASQG